MLSRACQAHEAVESTVLAEYRLKFKIFGDVMS